MTYKRTEKAAEKGLKSDWEVIEAIAADAIEAGDPIVSADSIRSTVDACEAAGRGMAVSTAKTYCAVAKFDHEATSRDRAVFRRYGLSIIRQFAQAGWSQEAAATFLKGSHKSYRDVEAEVRPTSSRATTAKATDPEEWDDNQWEAFDASVVSASRTVLTAFNLRQRGLYEPSVEAIAQLALLRDSDWDRGLAELVEG